MSEQEAVKISYWKTNEGIIFEYAFLWIDNSKKLPRVNGVLCEHLYLDNWWIARGVADLEKFETDGGTRQINRRYELSNPAVACVRSVIPKEELDAAGGFDSGEFKGMSGLYEYKYEAESVGYIERAFTPECKGSLAIESLGDPAKFRYTLAGDYNKSNSKEVELTWKSIYESYEWSRQIHVSDVQRALTPRIAWHLGPCVISSHTVYRIIRHHVKTHIDPNVAEISSDYDFCFGVAKRIAIKPYERTKTIQKSKRYKPQLTTEVVTYEKKPIFEVGHKAHPYGNYPQVDDFRGESLEDLAANIDAYLNALMEAINEPLAKCPTCNGCAVVNLRKIAANERNVNALRNPKLLEEGA